MIKKIVVSICIFCSLSLFAWTQETFPVNGVFDHRDGKYAFTNATIYVSPQKVIKNATLLVEDGKVKAVNTANAPKDAIVIDIKGKYIYPSFIDPYSNYGMPVPKAEGASHRLRPQMLSNKKGAYSWNEALKTEFRADVAFKADEKAAKELRNIGFGAVITHRHDGISRGASALVQLGQKREHELILKNQVAHQMSFNKGTSTQSYPSSLMGGIALVRQTYLDADWYASPANEKEYNISLQTWNHLKSLPQVFAVRDRLEILRATKIAKEFNQNYIIKGSGDEYMRIDAIKNTQSPLIIPVNYPKPYDVSDTYDTEQISLSDMKHWELAPSNAYFLQKANIPFSFTSYGLKDKKDFLKNIRLAIKRGLSEEQALAALTTTPARLLKVEHLVGTLETGKTANFIITDRPLFDEKAVIYQNWVAGQGFIIRPFKVESPLADGGYKLKVGKKEYLLHLSKNKEKTKYKIILNDSTNLTVNYTYADGVFNMSFAEKGKKTRLSGTVNAPTAQGKGYNGHGEWITWSISPSKQIPKTEHNKSQKDTTAPKTETLGAITYPFLPYGWEEQPTAKTTLIKNATLWTNEEEGIIQADILIAKGKIVKVGKDIKASADVVIDATGKHVTSGIIDEHSHIAISRGVNEGTQYSSAEVSIADVINSDDVNIYRNLAGGVVAVQLLHGSANPIGGQSGIIKLRWGLTPDEMKIEHAAPFIKFALGENVKQSNWGDANVIRFPQSRMGVEQVYEDHFTRAKEYGKLKRSGKPYRKNLEMEVLLEILEKKRFISCHSYVQSEINMLMKVAERHGFVLNTFTHILEGYKVADKMKKHGAGGSTFSDWWAYKYEVIDAIPFNAAILSEMGVVTAINSDDGEMSRRLNQEAAKTIMYGGVSEEEAWKFITLNPAKLLHLDDKMGSLKEGKDADIVIWSQNPLSIYAHAEQTYVDGVLYYDMKRDKEMRTEIRKERNRLIQKMINEKAKGTKTQAPVMRHKHHYHCDHVEDEMAD